MTEFVGHIRDGALLPLAQQFCAAVMSASPPSETIHREGEGDEAYLQRWFVARKNMIPTVIGERISREESRAVSEFVPSMIENVYVHRFGAGDANETLHDHPWWNASLIVSGGYTEQLDYRSVDRVAGDVVIRSADDRHAIREVLPNTITLFGTGVKTREWGFWVDGEFVHWRDFHNHTVENECQL